MGGAVYFSCLLHILYKTTVFMEKQQWKRMNGSQGAPLAYMHNGPAFSVSSVTRWLDLWNDHRWQHSEPEVAVVEWLSQGIPVPVGSEQ